jgi:DNA-binding LacI/PurR family transcriptional regulator
MADAHHSRYARHFTSALQVAKLAGVSRSAVSRAFTDGASIAPKTRDKVMQAAQALGYHVNDLARGLLARRSRLVGIVVTKPEEGIRAQLLAALTARLIRRGSVPIVLNTGLTVEERASAQRILMGHMAEAVIVLSGSPPSSFCRGGRRNGQPVIVLGRSGPDTDHLMTNNAAAGRPAAALFPRLRHAAQTRQLLGRHTQPHRARTRSEARRSAGARGVVVRGGCPIEGGVAAAKALLARRSPQAVFCVNDLWPRPHRHARRSGASRCPRGLSVIGFDDIPRRRGRSIG